MMLGVDVMVQVVAETFKAINVHHAGWNLNMHVREHCSLCSCQPPVEPRVECRAVKALNGGRDCDGAPGKVLLGGLKQRRAQHFGAVADLFAQAINDLQTCK